jgi:hypothetical protein
MTRRRRGRRPGESPVGEDPDKQPRVGPDGRPDFAGGYKQPRVGPDGRPDFAGGYKQPRVGPDGRPDDPRGGYTPPPSPLTRWQYHTSHQQRMAKANNAGRARWSAGGAASARPERRGGPPPQDRPRGFDPTARPAPGGGDARRPRANDRFGRRNDRPSRGGDERPAPRHEPPRVPSASTIDAFELFCAYHLGITPDDGYRIQNIHEVARRFGTNAAELRQVLTNLGMAADDIVHSGFDLPSAQVDIMVAPAGISRRELARPLYDEFRTAPKKSRNWAREMEDAQRQIDETIGRDGRWSPGRRDPAGKQS